jgi:hypothetical protein
MADALNPDDKVKILPPDRTLQQKIGTANLDQLLSPQVVEDAQQVIVRSSDQLLDESIAEMKKMVLAAQSLSAAPDKARQALREVTASAFSLKAKAGLGGYDLISLLAKSLNQRCEQIGDSVVAVAQLPVLKWHVESLERLLSLKVKGMGGQVGEAILKELEKLGVKTDQSAAEDTE